MLAAEKAETSRDIPSRLFLVVSAEAAASSDAAASMGSPRD
jgi:hypothetical protein